MRDIKDHFMKKQRFYSFVFSLLASLCCASVDVQDSGRHICRDDRSEEYFSFILPQGWVVTDSRDHSGKNKNRIYRHVQDLGICPASGATVAVCHQAGKSYAQAPLVFIFKTYISGTGSELEAQWGSGKYQKRKNKQLASVESLNFPRGGNMRITRSDYTYHEDIHTAYETVEGTDHGIRFVRISATILGGLNHATVACHFEGEDCHIVAALIDRIVKTFEHESDNVFGGPLEQRALRQQSSGTGFIESGVLLFFCVPMALGATFGIWLSARRQGVRCPFFVSLLVGAVTAVIFMLPPHNLHMSMFISAVIVFTLLALFIREAYAELVWISAYGLAGGYLGFMAVWAYTWIGAAMSGL